MDSRWAQEKDRPERDKKKKDKDASKDEGASPFPLPIKSARLPEGWAVVVEGVNVFRMDECLVTLATPDGLLLHNIDDVRLPLGFLSCFDLCARFVCGLGL